MVIIADKMKVGEVYGFTYSGGSRSGEPRVVLITGSNYGLVSGVDLTGPKGDRFRNFSVRGIKNIETIEYTVVDLTALPKSFDVKSLVDGYEKEGKVAVEHEGKVYVADAPVAKPKRRFSPANKVLLTSILVDNKHYIINNEGGITEYDTGRKLTDEEFVKIVVGK